MISSCSVNEPLVYVTLYVNVLGLDVLVNNAGMSAPGKPVSAVTAEEWDFMFRLNVTSPMIVAREALQHLRKVKGNIIFISSVRGKNKNETMRYESRSSLNVP